MENAQSLYALSSVDAGCTISSSGTMSTDKKSIHTNFLELVCHYHVLALLCRFIKFTEILK